MTASGSRIAEIAGRHRRGSGADAPWCWECTQKWPCDASILAALLTPERLRLVYDRVWQAQTNFRRDPAFWRKVIAALEAQS